VMPARFLGIEGGSTSGFMRVFGIMLLSVWFGELKIWSLGVKGWGGEAGGIGERGDSRSRRGGWSVMCAVLLRDGKTSRLWERARGGDSSFLWFADIKHVRRRQGGRLVYV